jgi:hypothetical protein
MALAMNTPRTFGATMPASDIELPVAASAVIYEGAALSDVGGAGYADALTIPENFLGFAMAACDNTGGSAGDKTVRVRREGDVLLTVAGAAATAVTAIVYAADDGTFTLTVGTNTPIGRVVRYNADGTCWVHFEALSQRDAS